MLTLNKILPALGVALMLASGVANAIPHPQFGDATTIGSHDAASGLEEGIKQAAGAVQLNIDAFPDVNLETSG